MKKIQKFKKSYNRNYQNKIHKIAIYNDQDKIFKKNHTTKIKIEFKKKKKYRIK